MPMFAKNRVCRSGRDRDLDRMARRGHGVPSQDPDAGAQLPLQEHERLRELQSTFTGGGLLAGMAAGGTVGMLLAGPLGVALGCALGAVAGTAAGLGLGRSAGLAGTAVPSHSVPLAD